MPFASFIKVREVSSEDNIHLAENLINGQAIKKWKTKNVGEKSAYVILEMSESYQIVGIDIGNEHSAFVEVLVGKSTSAPEDFKEILLTCSFMTPLESKSSININRVRCFSKEALVPNVMENKWSLLKIICTQPFNKHIQYGLSFIKLHVLENQKSKIKETPRPLVTDQVEKEKRDKLANNVTKLKFREDSPESEGDDTTSLFSRWKKLRDENVGFMPAINKDEMVFQRRFNSEQSANCSQTDKPVSSIRDRNRDHLAFEDDNLEKNSNLDKLERLSKHIKDDKERRCLEMEKIAEKKSAQLSDNKKLQMSSSLMINDKTDGTCKNLKRVKKQESLPSVNNKKKIKTSTKCAPFNNLLKGVVLVISGVQNPERGDLRNKAIAMGAKYKADWDSTCTHLICAFKNTPKYKQVTGKGKIVSPSWIKNCYTLKKYLPWRRYALDSNELNKQESDEEICVNQTSKINSDEDSAASDEYILVSEPNRQHNALGIYDVDDRQQMSSVTNEEIFSDCDTDDEIKKIEEGLNSNKKDIYDASTDEDDYLKDKYRQM